MRRCWLWTRALRTAAVCVQHELPVNFCDPVFVIQLNAQLIPRDHTLRLCPLAAYMHPHLAVQALRRTRSMRSRLQWCRWAASLAWSSALSCAVPSAWANTRRARACGNPSVDTRSTRTASIRGCRRAGFAPSASKAAPDASSRISSGLHSSAAGRSLTKQQPATFSMEAAHTAFGRQAIPVHTGSLIGVPGGAVSTDLYHGRMCMHMTSSAPDFMYHHCSSSSQACAR